MLNVALDRLQKAQDELVAREKLAAMGRLVAGMAHEINTPLGNAITAVTHLIDDSDDFAARFEENKLRRIDLESHLTAVKDDLASAIRNLHRAAELVNLFKQLGVDHASGHFRSFRVREYIDDVIESLRPRLKHLPHHIEVRCPENATLCANHHESYRQFHNARI
jgi:C4-dicarboxylate-specific signal transduction histidine kinase